MPVLAGQAAGLVHVPMLPDCAPPSLFPAPQLAGTLTRAVGSAADFDGSGAADAAAAGAGAVGHCGVHSD